MAEVSEDRPRFLVRTLGYAAGFVSIRSDAELRIAGPADLAFELLDSDRGFVALTSFRRSASVAENVALFHAVPKRLGAKLGTRTPGYWLIGHWQATGEAGVVVDEIEYVWLIPQPESVVAAEWLGATAAIASESGQEAFVIRSSGDGEAHVMGTDGRSWGPLARGGEIAFALGVLARERAMIGGVDRERVLDDLRHRPADEDAMPRVSFHIATAGSIGTRWLFRHIDALPGPRL